MSDSNRRVLGSAPVATSEVGQRIVLDVPRPGEILPSSPARIRALPSTGNLLPPHLADEYVNEEEEPASPIVREEQGPKSRGKKTVFGYYFLLVDVFISQMGWKNVASARESSKPRRRRWKNLTRSGDIQHDSLSNF